MTSRQRSRAIIAVFLLVATCLFWGASFPVAQYAMRAMAGALGAASGDDLPMRLRIGASATYNGWRFLAAALAYWLLTCRRQRGYKREDLRGALWVGLFSAVGMLAQLVGLGYTLPSVAGFLTALTVVFAPLGQARMLRRPVGGETWLAAGMALAGIALLCRLDPAALTGRTLAVAPPVPYLGEGLIVLAAIFFTGQILSIDHYGKSADAVRLTFLVLLFTGLLSLVAGAALSGREVYTRHVLGSLAGNLGFVGCLLCLALLCSAVALHLMNVYQPRISPATAAVVYCLEPLWATLFSVAFRTETLTLTTLAGGAVIVAAVLVVAHAMRAREQVERLAGAEPVGVDAQLNSLVRPADKQFAGTRD